MFIVYASLSSFKVFGNGATRLLVRKSGSTPSTAHIEVKEPPETQSLIRLALKELNDVTSESNRKCVEDYLTTYCVPTDEVGFSGQTFAVLKMAVGEHGLYTFSFLMFHRCITGISKTIHSLRSSH